MADVRSLLRNERATRRITHPHAFYSASGVLGCLVCRTQLKSEAFWDAHLHSKEHATRLKAEVEARTILEASQSSRKRKAGDDESLDRKKSRAELPDVEEEEPTSPEDPREEAAAGPVADEENISEAARSGPNAVAVEQSRDKVDEDEWAAFERDVATPPPVPPVASNSAATIEAAPISAAELAEQANTDGSASKRRRDAELEDEREDVSKQLEDEFDEMNELEQRVRRLKERREAIRKAQGIVANQNGTSVKHDSDQERYQDNHADDDDDDDDDDQVDDWDNWR